MAKGENVHDMKFVKGSLKVIGFTNSNLIFNVRQCSYMYVITRVMMNKHFIAR